MKGPLRNGSSGTTIEILLLLTVTGASALTLLALGPRSAPDRKAKKEHDADDRDDAPSR